MKGLRENKIVLIIEDEAPMRNALTEKLGQAGITTYVAKDGEEGLEKALSSHPDLILLDWVLPKLNGSQVLKKLREDEWGKSIPVVMLTILSDPEIVSQMKDLGVDLFFSKTDSKLEDVVKEVRRIIQQ